MTTTSPRGVLIINPLSTLLGLFPIFPIILLATNECVALGLINACTGNEFNYKVPVITFGASLTSSCVM
jgi:hypothetical protein